MSNIIRDGLQAQQAESDSQQGFTYDEGGGIKDTVLMTGPLSEIYTKALNVYFQKRDLTQPEAAADDGDKAAQKVDDKLNAKEGQSEEVAMESQNLDEAMLTEILNELDQENVDRSMGLGLKFTAGKSPEAAATEISTTAYIMEMQQAMRPEVVEQIQTAKANSEYHTVLVVYTRPLGHTIGMIPDVKTLTINQGNRKVSSSDSVNQFMIAHEELYTKHGIPVFHGIGAFLEDYKKRNYD